MKLRPIYSITVFVVAMFSCATSVFAVELLITAPDIALGVGSQFEVELVLNTQGTDINALEGTVSFPEDVLSFLGLYEENSLVSFWVEKPHLISDNQVLFSGIAPGGYEGKNGVVFRLVFQATHAGKGFIAMDSIVVLANDGNATEIPVTARSASITVLQDAPMFMEELSLIQRDSNPPELFEPVISRLPEIGEDRYMLIFATQDKQSGIDHYEVSEGRFPFATATSPYLLSNQRLTEKIRIKAVDKNGNERIVVMSAQNPQVWRAYSLILAIIIIGTILVLRARRRGTHKFNS